MEKGWAMRTSASYTAESPWGVVFTDDVAHNTRGFFMRPVVGVAEIVHGEQNPPVHRFQTIAYVRYGAPDDDAERIFQVRFFYFLFNINGFNHGFVLVAGKLECLRLQSFNFLKPWLKTFGALVK